jgi:hypothetical protein
LVLQAVLAVLLLLPAGRLLHVKGPLLLLLGPPQHAAAIA